MSCKQSSFMPNHGVFLWWQNFNPFQLHSKFTPNCPWRRIKDRFLMDSSLGLFLCLESKVLGVRESECWTLSPLPSTIKYRRTSIPLPISPIEARVSEKIHRQQSTLSFQGLFPTIPLPVPIRLLKRFPYSTFHESTAKSANLCQFLLHSAERFPFLPWVAQGCSGF